MPYTGDSDIIICTIDGAINSGSTIILDGADVVIGGIRDDVFWITGTSISTLTAGTVELTLSGKAGNMPVFVDLPKVTLLFVSGEPIVFASAPADIKYAFIRIKTIKNVTTGILNDCILHIAGKNYLY